MEKPWEILALSGRVPKRIGKGALTERSGWVLGAGCWTPKPDASTQWKVRVGVLLRGSRHPSTLLCELPGGTVLN